MINTPTEDLLTLENLQKHLESVRNNITLNEAELRRLSGLVGSEKYAVNELVNHKKALEEEIAAINEQNNNQKELHEAEIKELENQCGEKQKELALINQKINDANDSYIKSLKDVDDEKQKEQIKKQEEEKNLNTLLQKEQLLKEQLAVLENKIQAITDRENKLKSLINIIENALK